MPDAHASRQANRLYWETDSSVADIADELDISRRMLYDLLEPCPADRPCPECGASLGFRNRTALDRRQAECPECTAEILLTAETDPGSGPGTDGDAPADRTRGMEPQVEQERAAGHLSPMAGRSRPASASGLLLGGALLVGLAAGVTGAYLVRHR
jgi:hypothetical protein